VRAITRRGTVPVWAACLTVMARGGGEGGRPTRMGRKGRKGGSVRPPNGSDWGMPRLRCARFQPYRGKPYVRLIGGREETGASRACIAVRRAAPPAYPACVDGPELPGLPIRALRRRRDRALHHAPPGAIRAEPDRPADGRGRAHASPGEDADRLLQGRWLRTHKRFSRWWTGLLSRQPGLFAHWRLARTYQC